VLSYALGKYLPVSEPFTNIAELPSVSGRRWKIRQLHGLREPDARDPALLELLLVMMCYWEVSQIQGLVAMVLGNPAAGRTWTLIGRRDAKDHTEILSS
jgi:hypothetical protein